MNTYSPFNSDSDSDFDSHSRSWRHVAEATLQQLATTGSHAEAVSLKAANLPEDETRDQLINAQLHTGLHQTAATFTLWRDLLRDAGVEAGLHRALFESLTGRFNDDDQCVALCGIADELNKSCAVLTQPAVVEVLAQQPGHHTSLAVALVRVHLGDELSAEQFATEIAEHARTDHPNIWSRLVELVTSVAGVAAVDQWRAATHVFARASDDLLRHLNRRAEGGYPASDSEVRIVSTLLDTEVTRGGDGCLTVEAGWCPWRDERGRVTHPLGLEQTGA